MDRRTFETIVRDTIENLPEEFHHALENVAIMVEEEPDPAALQELHLDPDDELFGVYVGVPLIDRGTAHTALPHLAHARWSRAMRLISVPPLIGVLSLAARQGPR